MIMLLITSIYAALLAGLLIREHVIADELSSLKLMEWNELLYSLKSVRTNELQHLASCSDCKEPAVSISEPGVLSRIGGPEGLHRLRENATIILELAYRTEEWGTSEKIKVIKAIRSAVSQLRRCVRFHNCAARLGYRGDTSESLREIASLYCYIVREMVELYRITHIARTEQVSAACNWS